VKLSYEAFDAKGVASRGEIEAASPAEATELLRRKGLFVSTVTAVGHAGGARKASTRTARTGWRLRNIAMLSRQLQVLVSSGTPLVQALHAIERQSEDKRWTSVLETLRTRVEEGIPLSEAMRLRPDVFDCVCLSLVSAGEASGDMSAMLDRLALLSRKQLQLRNAVAGALVYPLVLIVMGVIVMITMLLFVLPRFADLFAQLDSPLPPTTRFLMWLSGMLLEFWWAVLLGAAVLTFSIRAYFNSAIGRHACQDFLLKFPKLGRLTRSIFTAKLARMLGVLLESKVTLLDALKLTRESATYNRYIDLLAQAEEAVGKGDPISAILSESDLISPSVQEAIRTGEQSGRLGAPLLQMADFLDDENDIVVKSLTRLLEPLILGVLGVLVGIVALSMFLPLFDLVASAQGGH
jgi:type II secretory pathway component PulF